MSGAEALPKEQAAELHLDDLPTHTGAVRRATDTGLILDNPRPLLVDSSSQPAELPTDARGELIFPELLDDTGKLLVVPVSTGGTADGALTLEFLEPDSDVTLALQQKLLIRPRLRRTERANHLLGELRKRSTRQLDTEIGKFLPALSDHLLDVSSRPHGVGQQELFYDSMNIIKRHKDRLRDKTCDIVESYFSEPLKKEDDANPESPSVDFSELGLVDVQDFEDSLNVQQMVEAGQRRYEMALECLTLRFAELADIDPHQARLPVDVAQICQAFKESLQAIKVPPDAMPEIYALFSDRVIRHLDFYYSSLNTYLSDQGVIPDIEQSILKHGSILHRYRKEPDRDTPQAPAVSEAASPSAATPTAEGLGNMSAEISSGVVDAIAKQFNPDKLYRSVIDALNFQHNQEASVSNGGKRAAPTGNEADAQILARALSSLQQDRDSRKEVQTSTSLRQYLSENQKNISELKGTSGFANESLNQLDLVDSMFNSLRTDVDVTPDLRPALEDLQIPLARLALLEPQFFLDKQHPARGVVDKLTQLSASGNYPNNALQTRLSHIITNIVENFDSDSDIFNTALSDLDKLTVQQQQALARNVARVVETQEGQARLSRAKQAVATLLSSRLRPPRAPKVLVDLVDTAWRDLLTLTHVKEGPSSQAWKDYVRTLDTLSLWLLQHQKGDMSDHVSVERALEAEPFIDLVRQQISNALPTNLDHEPVLQELGEVLAGRAELLMVAVDESSEESGRSAVEIREKVDALPRLRRWVSRVDDLKTGAWLSFKDEEGKKRRMQLAWIGDQKDRYIFVNVRGQKIADLNNIELARQLSRGVKPSSSADELSVVDQSMYNTLENVQKTLSFAKNRDTLTKLINHESFAEQMQQALRHAKTKHAHHGLLYIDIDQFALVNEVYDEPTGDQVLGEFAALLAQQHSARISSARLGGDRFAVLLLNKTIEQTLAHAEKIRADIESSPVAIDQERVSFTVSIGVCGLVDHSLSVEDVLIHAQTAARQAKKDGRNRVVQFHEDQVQAEKFLAMEAEARSAIEMTLQTEKFQLQAQPIVRTSTVGDGDVHNHYEILLAMRDDEGRLSSPQEFIIDAERFGHMVTVDRWVIKQVFSWISRLGDVQKQVPYLSINLSGNSVSDDAFMEYLFEQISEYGVGTNRICFEITETGTISNMVKAADFVREFKNIGCRFSIDDFGTGLASHTYLRELPVDFVKIDGAFVTRINVSDNDYAMVKSINDLAHFLGQETIAEFAESDEIIARLTEIGVDHLQGWGIGKPVPLLDLTDKLSNVEK
jgi:diguanylate cyclase (GGDEF)-like protein